MPTQPPKPPTSVTVTCRCGAYHIIPVAQFGRLQTCKKCGAGYSVLWKRDPKTNKQVPRLLASAKPRKAKPALSPESMVDLACGCGYRRKAAPDEIRKSPRCPGCGSLMFVDRPARVNKESSGRLTPYVEQSRYGKLNRLPSTTRMTPPPFPAPVQPTPPPMKAPAPAAFKAPTPSSATPTPPANNGETRVTSSGKIVVICTYCGDRQLVSAEKQGTQIKCLRCETMVRVKPPPTPREPEPPPPPPPPPPVVEETVNFDAEIVDAPPPRPAPEFVTGAMLGCPCGAELDVRGASPGSVYSCENCGRRVTMEKARHPQTLSTVMKPLFEEPEVVVDSDASDVICSCGEALLVSASDIGHPMQCPSCSVLLDVQRTPHGLQVKPVGRADGGEWSLQDFS